MMDDDDLHLVVLASPSGGGCLGAAVVLAILAVCAYVVYQNHNECAEKTCSPGLTSQLLNHQCLCVEIAK